MEKVNIAEKFARFTEQWKPKVVGQLNGQQVKVVKFHGPFVWHHHEKAHVLLFEQASTLNTGNVLNERTVADPERL
jgi:hypothetical protein